jgi:hypothetical protein
VVAAVVRLLPALAGSVEKARPVGELMRAAVAGPPLPPNPPTPHVPAMVETVPSLEINLMALAEVSAK